MSCRFFTLLLISGCSDYGLHSPSLTSRGGAPEPTATSLSTYRQADSWVLTQDGGVDVLFFGDTSGSMAEELTTLGDEIINFVDRLDDRVENWQLMAVTGPAGCGLHGVISPADEDYDLLFAEAITTPPGEDLVDEWGLYNLTSALIQTQRGDCNEGFLRENASLHMIFISDEDDNSPGWDQGDPDYWRDYLDTMIAIKGDESQVFISAVTGPSPAGCAGAEPGTGYNDAVAWADGEVLSICGNWEEEVHLLADAGLLHQTVFQLSDPPIESTLLVQINGSPVPAGWSYDSEEQSVVFHQGAPLTGDEVTIDYRVLSSED